MHSVCYCFEKAAQHICKTSHGPPTLLWTDVKTRACDPKSQTGAAIWRGFFCCVKTRKGLCFGGTERASDCGVPVCPEKKAPKL